MRLINLGLHSIGDKLIWCKYRQSITTSFSLDDTSISFKNANCKESALRRFKRKAQQESIIKEIKKHSVYLKPRERKRLKLAMAQKVKKRISGIVFNVILLTFISES